MPILGSRGLAFRIQEENKSADADALAESPINCLLCMLLIDLGAAKLIC